MDGKLQWILGCVCGALFLILSYEIIAPRPAYSVPQVSVAPIPALPKPPGLLLAPPASEFAAIADRPLFDAQRKKYVPPPVDPTAKQAPPPPPTLSLVGVIIDADHKIAMVKSSDGMLAASMSEGAEIGGWHLATIEPDRIVLKFGASEHEVRLDANKAPPQQPVAPNISAPQVSQQQTIRSTGTLSGAPDKQ